MTKLPSFLIIYNELISTPTISSLVNDKIDYSNKTLLDKLANWLDDFGFETTITAVPNTRNKFNLLATYKNQICSESGGLLLSGHSDTVPFDEALWSKDPFKITEDKQRWYGLGTADMKGFFAFIIESLKQIDLNTLTKPLHILATADEEITMAGARFFAENSKLKPDCTIVGEPTSLIPIRAHKGFTANSIYIIGKTGHSSDPDKGINAIEIMNQVIHHLLKLKQKLRDEYHNDSFAVPYPTLNLGVIHGGDSANRICGCCELLMDLRILPGMDATSMLDMVINALKPVIDKYPNLISVTNEVIPISGFACNHDDSALQQVEQLVNKKSETVNYSTEAPFLSQLSSTIVLGPGSIEQAHQPDEFVDMSYFKPTVETITRLIQQFCIN